LAAIKLQELFSSWTLDAPRADMICKSRMSALGQKQPLTSLAAQWLLSAISGRLDHQLGEGSMACMRFTLSKSLDQSLNKS
jgi:hypothetical protein